MTMPIGGSGSTPSTDPVTSSSVVDNSDTDSTVSSGYGTNDTVSYTEGDGTAFESSEVSLDTPSATEEASEETFQQAIARRLAGSSSLLSAYSNHLTTGAGGFDIQSDTASILLVLRGFINDLNTINNAQDIATVVNERQFLQEQRLEIARLNVEIQSVQGEIVTKVAELAKAKIELVTNTSALDALTSSLSTAQAGGTADPAVVSALASAFSGQPEIIDAINHIRTTAVSGVAPDSDQVALVNNKITRLQAVISTLQAEVAASTSDIASLKATNENNKILLAIRIALLAVAETEEVLIRAYMFDPARTDEEEQREVGEEKIGELREDLKRLLEFYEGEDTAKVLQDSLALTSVKQEGIESDNRHYANIDPQSIAVLLREVLLPEIFGDLADVFNLQNVDTLNYVNNQGVPSEQDIQGVTEAIAVVLLAGIEAHHDERSNIENAYLANSEHSQSFALMLLREEMAEVAHELAEKSGQSSALGNVSKDQVARILDTERKVDELVLNARKDQALSQSAIRRANRV